jgi:hypothetical protein
MLANHSTADCRGDRMQRANMPSDRRAFGRRESRIHAFAKISGRGAEPCVVRNVSDSGALLAFASSFEPPARFRLTVEAKGIDVLCEVRRRDGNEYGVAFVEGDAVGQNLLEQPYGETPARLPPVEEATELPAPNVLGREGIVTVITGAEMRRHRVV